MGFRFLLPRVPGHKMATLLTARIHYWRSRILRTSPQLIHCVITLFCLPLLFLLNLPNIGELYVPENGSCIIEIARNVLLVLLCIYIVTYTVYLFEHQPICLPVAFIPVTGRLGVEVY